jgi:uncharacterized HAD superfamily protein
MVMKIAFDLDGTITAFPEFFRLLSECWNDDVYVITFRSGYDEAVDEAKKRGIKFTELYLAKDDDDKARIVKQLGVEAFFDDMPEFLIHVAKNVACFLVRGEYNFDSRDKQFVFSKYTGKLTEE